MGFPPQYYAQYINNLIQCTFLMVILSNQMTKYIFAILI